MSEFKIIEDEDCLFVDYKNVSYTIDKIEELDEIAVEGKCFVYFKPDNYFTDKGFVSNILTNPTWRDIMIIANDQIETTKDYHHRFLEGIDEVKIINENGLKQIELSLGS